MDSWDDYREVFGKAKNYIFYTQRSQLEKELRMWDFLKDDLQNFTKLFCYGESGLLKVQLGDMPQLEYLSFHVAHLSIEAAAAILSHPTLKFSVIVGVKLEDSPGYHMLASASKTLDLNIRLHPDTKWVGPDIDALMRRCFFTLKGR